MARWKSLALVVLLVTTIAVVPATALATTHNVAEARSYTVTVGYEDYDIYTLSSGAGSLTARVTSISGGAIDIYVFTTSQLADYENPNAPSFGYEWLSEHRSGDTSVSGTLSSSRHLVVDNAYISASGAVPSGDVTYTVTFEVAKGIDPAIIGAVLLLIIILVVVVVVVVVVVRRRQSAAAQKQAFYGTEQAPPGGAPPFGTGAPAYGATTPPPYGAPATASPPAPPPASQPAGEAACPNCGAPVAFYAPKCNSCGNALNWS